VTLAERLLLLLSRDPAAPDYDAPVDEIMDGEHTSAEPALALLTQVFPGFVDGLHGKRVLDFGCGEGRQAIALASHGAKLVVGVDSNPATLARAVRSRAAGNSKAEILFVEELPQHLLGQFDIVVSKDSMEHFRHPERALAAMIAALAPGGRLFLTFGPPWYSPYGSHTRFFTRVPWVNILFSEQTVMAVRAHFRTDGATRYEDVESGLNKMSVGRFERLVQHAGMIATYTRLDCVKGLNFAARLPLVRELMINQVSAILARGVQDPS